MGGGNSDGYTRNEWSKEDAEIFSSQERSGKQLKFLKAIEFYLAQSRKTEQVIYTNSKEFKKYIEVLNPSVKVELLEVTDLLSGQFYGKLPKVAKDDLNKYYPYPEEGPYFGFYESDWLNTMFKEGKIE